MLTDPVIQAGALWLAAIAAAAAAWPVRRADPWSRAAILACIAAFCFVLPLFYQHGPVVLRFVTVLLCPVMGGKLLSLGLEAEWWEKKRLGDWVWYLVLVSLLVPRLHVGAPGRERAARPLVQGLVEVSAGIALLWWAFGADLGRVSFWLDHTVKLVGMYLCVFDGMFVLKTGVARSLGIRLLDLSRGPIWSATPAEFWRRYNCEAGRFLREDVYRPLEKRIGRAGAIAFVFAANGALHEYLAWLLVGRVQGYQLAFFAVQGVAVMLTWKWRPRGWMRWAAWLGTIAFMVVSSVLFFATLQQVTSWYANGGLLP